MTDSPLPKPEDVTVLVVDDELDVARYLSSILDDAGMTVHVAHDGEQALQVMKEHTPNLISLDLVMPRKSGIRFLSELRRNREWSRIPVIIVTAHARDADVRDGLDSVLADSTMVGPSLYLEKPVTPHSYLRSVCQVLGVEMPEQDGSDALRDEAMDLLGDADSETLANILGQLRKSHG